MNLVYSWTSARTQIQRMKWLQIAKQERLDVLSTVLGFVNYTMYPSSALTLSLTNHTEV